MNTRQFARALGRRGGLARAKRLSSEQRKKIASLGGQVKAMSAKALRRIRENFIYLDIIEDLKKPPSVKAVSDVRHPLPAIYAKNG